MKESYIQNAKDIESIIDERLDSFKGTLGKLKSESKEPGIIWSFDAGDVQEAMTDTISKANTRILMMYPWIRNIDVGILKKFMDTDSCIIVQEASLDDDASVELLKLLLDKNVKIRTMPHVHTIAVVSDETSGLIISTDPIYESYEVGVVYKDLKSIEEIERLFHDAWEISQEVDLEIKS
jgi:sugar-specific transcriptional regulator TrmB